MTMMFSHLSDEGPLLETVLSFLVVKNLNRFKLPTNTGNAMSISS